MSTKTHFFAKSSAFGGRFLFCTGRHVDFAQVSSRADQVTCKSCIRKLVREAIAAAALPFLVKCDDCKVDMRRCATEGESARGGRCDACRAVA